MAIDMRLIDSNYEYDRNGKIAKLVENVAKTFNETPFLFRYSINLFRYWDS